MGTLKIVDPDQRYKDDVVTRLEGLLKAAREGEILSIIYACERSGGCVTTGSSFLKNRYAMLGYLSCLMYSINQSLDETAEPSDLEGED